MAKLISELFRKTIKNNQIHFKCYSSVKSLPKSSLLISGKRATDTYIVVTPHLDFDEQFKNTSLLEENIKRRELDLNVSEMKDSWEFYKDWNKRKLQLQENLRDARKQINELSKLNESAEKKTQLEKLELYSSLVSEELQVVKENVWSMEDNVISNLLKIPNVINSETPGKEEEIFVYAKEHVAEGSCHLKVGEKLNCLEYRHPLNYFLKNEAALFELALPEYVVDLFNNHGFIRFSNPDSARSVLAEGVGLSPGDLTELYLLEQTEGNNDLMYLCGGGTLFPFCGYHAKEAVAKHSLPVKYIAVGRSYNPTRATLPGLFSVNQLTSVQLFTATYNEKEVLHEYHSCIDYVSEVFSALELKFKIVKQPPCYLKSWESLRASVQVFSPYNKVFVEVGHISLIGDFISKRLRMCYSDKGEEPFLHVVSGTVVNTQVLLALCLERSQNTLFVPDAVKKYMVL